MDRHHIVIMIGNQSTGQVLKGEVFDTQYDILDQVKAKLEEMLTTYRRQYPLGLTSGPKPEIIIK